MALRPADADQELLMSHLAFECLRDVAPGQGQVRRVMSLFVSQRAGWCECRRRAAHADR